MKPAVFIKGMFGIGDNIHQRAVMRTLMEKYEVYLETNYTKMYWDLVQQGLKLVLVKRAYTLGLEPNFDNEKSYDLPPDAKVMKLSYNSGSIRHYGSILAAQFAAVREKMPLHPDFSLPIPDEWRDIARGWIRDWGVEDNPIMIYRPIINNKIWLRQNRSPDPVAYDALYRSIRDRFFVISVCTLNTGRETIGGIPADVDIQMNNGELDFCALAGLFAEANLIFGTAGFTPVLGQAVGKPTVTVYGGNECAKTTQSVGTHLAPTLSIEPDRPCSCHNPHHHCDKRMTIAPRIERLNDFIDLQQKRSLVFCTTYIDSEDKARLLDMWITNIRRNDDCDILIVDSKSPNFSIDGKHGDFVKHHMGMRVPRMLHQFTDNIGHLSRHGRDGWGRAFTYGLNAAIAGGYRYVVHIEGDSMFRLPIMPIIAEMERDGIQIYSIPVNGTKRQEEEWVETGLMFFKTSYVRNSNFINRYNWEVGGNKKYPHCPEWFVYQLVKNDLKIADWKGLRNDSNQVNRTNFTSFDLDWITHCVDQKLYEFFLGTNSLSRDYDSQFFSMHKNWRNEYEFIANMLNRRLHFRNAIDLGCGNGYFLSRFKELGKDVLGIDGSICAEPYFEDVKILDLTMPLPDFGKFDLAICTEVAEHIEEKYADQLVDNVCKVADKMIFFSAAKAGHGGHLHVNEQERDYWAEKFKKRGFWVDEKETEWIKIELGRNLSHVWWFAANAFVLRR